MSTELVRRAANTTGGRTAAARRLARQSSRTQQGLGNPQSWAFLTGDAYVGPLWAGEADAMGLPPFGRGVALLANAIAGTNWRAMRWDPDAGVDVRLPDQPAVLGDPDPTTTPWNYRWAATEDLILYGNHFALYGDLDFRTLRPGWLAPYPATDFSVLVDPFTGSGWLVGPQGQPLGPDQVFHVSAGNRSGEVLGRGVLAQYAEWLGGSVAAERHAGAYFAGGALPPAILQSPTVLTQTQAEELKSKWREMTSTREPVVLPSGYVLTPVVSNAEQAQLVESRTWNAQAVAMMLGIPSYKLGLPGTSMTYQNVESADIDFVRDSVDRYAHPLSEAFTKWLMPRGTTVAWDYAGRMRADTKSTAEVVGSLVSSGLLTLDEGRAMIGRAPLPEADAPATPPPDDQPPVPELAAPETGHLTPQEVA